jgi:hypothetical protein
MFSRLDGRDGYPRGQYQALWDGIQFAVVTQTPTHQEAGVILQDQVVHSFVGTQRLENFQRHLQDRTELVLRQPRFEKDSC